ncbi:MAG: hypothetical protein H7A37_04635 [Chlamydiales bacterium]|nr:hypothetical protein [Chlamydiia bacterium]MCP5507569.1 hypothetical protein [Chlamydiales bacterium]
MDSCNLITISSSDSLFSDYVEFDPDDEGNIEWVEMKPASDLSDEASKSTQLPFKITRSTTSLTDEQMDAIINSFQDLVLAKKIAEGKNPLRMTYGLCHHITPYCTMELAQQIIDYWNKNATWEENWF